jgi:ABC-type nitrate/sulfonate/bicarbonate transport system permease component
MTNGVAAAGGAAAGRLLIRGNRRRALQQALTAPAGVALFLLAWTAIAAELPPSRLVSPWAAATDLWNNFLQSPRMAVFGLGQTGYGALLAYTTRNVLIGWIVGGAIGILIGIASARFRPLRYVVDPIVLVLGTVPVLVAAPLFLLWFGVVPFTQVLLVGAYSAIMMVIFSQAAADNVDAVYEKSAMTLGASWRDRFRFVLIPGSIPEILGGLRITLASAWGLETFAEILGAPSGIGQAIKTLTNVNNVSGMLACVILVAATAIATDALVMLIGHRITRWA